MKEIIRQYGGFFVEAIVLVSLCFFLFINITDNNGNKGVFAIIGSNIPTVNVDYGTYSDFTSFKSEAAKTAPDIEYKRTDQMYTISNLLSDYIGTTTYSGNAAHIKVLSLMMRMEMTVWKHTMKQMEPLPFQIRVFISSVLKLRMI